MAAGAGSGSDCHCMHPAFTFWFRFPENKRHARVGTPLLLMCDFVANPNAWRLSHIACFFFRERKTMHAKACLGTSTWKHRCAMKLAVQLRRMIQARIPASPRFAHAWARQDPAPRSRREIRTLQAKLPYMRRRDLQPNSYTYINTCGLIYAISNVRKTCVFR